MLNIRKYPDPILKKVSEVVNEFDINLTNLIDDMFCTMYANRGVGLAAPQVGFSKQLFVINTEPGNKDKELVFINTKILSIDGEQSGIEGCLSFPGKFITKTRSKTVCVEAQDANGKKFTMTCEGLLARAVLHENDHCKGVLFIE